MIVCQAISVAITVVLPAPVASLRGGRGWPVRSPPPGVRGTGPFASGLAGNLGEPDHCLRGFRLTEERTEVAELVVPPVVEQPRRVFVWRVQDRRFENRCSTAVYCCKPRRP